MTSYLQPTCGFKQDKYHTNSTSSIDFLIGLSVGLIMGIIYRCGPTFIDRIGIGAHEKFNGSRLAQSICDFSFMPSHCNVGTTAVRNAPCVPLKHWNLFCCRCSQWVTRKIPLTVCCFCLYYKRTQWSSVSNVSMIDMLKKTFSIELRF